MNRSTRFCLLIRGVVRHVFFIFVHWVLLIFVLQIILSREHEQ